MPESPGSLNKRSRDSDSPKSASPSTASSTPSPSSTGAPRSIAGSKRVFHKIINRPLAPKPVGALPPNQLLPCSGAVPQLPVHLSAMQQAGPWVPPPTDVTAVPTQSTTSLTFDSTDNLAGMLPTTLPMNQIYYGQVENNFQPSSDQMVGGVPGQYDAGNLQLHSVTDIVPQQEQVQMLSNDAFAIWSNAPAGFE